MANYSAPSPIASTTSGTTTNPNTPRAELENQEAPEEGQVDATKLRLDKDAASPGGNEKVIEPYSSPSSSDTSRRRAYDIQPTWPRKVDQTKTRALVCWQPANRLDNVFLDIHWAPRGNAGGAFFKLHTGLHLEGAPSARRDGRVSAYIFIYPERIRQLTFDAQPQELPFGSNTIALTFDMNKSSALVLPKTYRGFGRGAEDAMSALRGIAGQLNFTVYAALARRTFSVTWMRQLCTSITDQRLSTIAACANLVNFYQGRGAQVLEGDSSPEHEDGDNVYPNPPAYEDAGPSPPLAPLTKGKKRRRRSSSAPPPAVEAGAASRPMDRTAVEALLDARLDARLAAHKSQVAEIHAIHKAEVVELLSAHKCEVLELLTALKTEVAAKLDGSETRVRQEVVDGLTEFVGEKVREEMGEVEDRVMDKITSMRLQASLTFPDHPLY